MSIDAIEGKTQMTETHGSSTELEARPGASDLVLRILVLKVPAK